MASFQQRRGYSAFGNPCLFPRVWPRPGIPDLSAVSSQGGPSGPSQKGSARGCQVPRGSSGEYLRANVQALSCECSREGSSLPVEVLGVATLSWLSRPSGRMCLAGRLAPGEQHAHGAWPCRFHPELLGSRPGGAAATSSYSLLSLGESRTVSAGRGSRRLTRKAGRHTTVNIASMPGPVAPRGTGCGRT